MIYNVEFSDRTLKQYSTNLIAENMLTQVDDNGFTMTMMQGIIDHNMNTTMVSICDSHVITRHGRKRLKKTTYA